MKRSILIATALVSIAALPARAQDVVTHEVRVRYDAAALAKPAARVALERRLAIAAARACTIGPVTGSMLPSTEEMHCRAVALANAHQQVERAMLIATRDRQLASANR